MIFPSRSFFRSPERSEGSLFRHQIACHKITFKPLSAWAKRHNNHVSLQTEGRGVKGSREYFSFKGSIREFFQKIFLRSLPSCGPLIRQYLPWPTPIILAFNVVKPSFRISWMRFCRTCLSKHYLPVLCPANGQPTISSPISRATTRYFFSALVVFWPNKHRHFLVIARKMIRNGRHGRAYPRHNSWSGFLPCAPN